MSCPDALLQDLPETQRECLLEVLAHDPRPQYHDDPERVYGMEYGGMEIKFKVEATKLTVLSVAHKSPEDVI